MVNLIASFDAGWQKRGSGFSRNSLSGHAALFGYHTGLLLGVSTKSKCCSGCRKGKSAEEHSCNQNWVGSSKGMEPAMGVELIANNRLMEQLSVRVIILIADDDAATISNIQKNVSWSMQKWSDINHMKKNFTSQLYAIKTPVVVIKYFTRRLMLTIQTNKNNPDAIRELLLSAVDHAYGNHTNCGLWCGYIEDPENYKYLNLPGKKPLSDATRKESIREIFRKVAENASKIAPCGSTQRNESFNHTVAVSHPKNLFFASTQSFPSRVKVAALKTNEKSSYILKIYEKAGYFPGCSSTQYRKAKDELAAIRTERSRDPEQRKRPNEKKLRRLQADAISENRKGISYSSGCGRFDFSSLGFALKDSNVEYVPTGDEVIVIFDLETTGLSDQTEICQIAAAVNEEKTFNVYSVPPHGMTKRASLITGLSVHNNSLYFKGELVESVSIKEALISFINFLKSVSENKKVILAAHNCFRFDSFVLLNHLHQYQLIDEFQITVKMFSDTLLAIQKHLPNRRKEGKSYALTSLTEEFIGPEALVNSHNAITDVDNILKIVNNFHLYNLLLQTTKSTQSILTRKARAIEINIIQHSLEPLNVSATMKKRTATAGITLKTLTDIFHRDGQSGIEFLLSESINGKPRITKNKKIIEKFVQDIEKLATMTNDNDNNNNNKPNVCVLNSDSDNSSEYTIQDDTDDDDDDFVHNIKNIDDKSMYERVNEDWEEEDDVIMDDNVDVYLFQEQL